MAQQKITYICEICKAEFQNQEKAEECERNHYQPVKIKTYDYGNHKPQFPLTINISLENMDGKEKVITYYRK